MAESLRIPQTAVAPFDPIGDSIKRRMGLVSRLGDGEFVDPGELAQADVNSMYSGNEFVKGLRRSAYSAGEAAKAYGGQLRELVDPAGGMQMQQEAAQSIRDMPRAWAPKVAEAKDVHSLEDFGSYAAGAIGEGLLTSATALGGTLVGGALGGPAGAWAGGTLPLVPLEGGGQVLDTLNDPVASQKPAWQRALAATGVGALNAGIENINERALVLPSLLGKGITSGMGLKNAAKTVGLSALRSAAGEGMEEGLQDLTGQYALQQLNPQKNIDFGQTLESMAKGAVAGAPMGAAGGSVQALRDNVAPISDSVSDSKKPKNEGPLTFDTIIGKLQSVADDPEQFGADVGNMTLNALTEAHKAYDKGVADYKENIAPVVDQGIDYMRKEGIDKAGDIVGKTAMDVNKFIADNIKDPTIRERFIQDASTLGAKTASDWEAFKLTLKAETGKDFQEGLGIAAGRIKDRAKEEAPKTFSWLKDTVKGLYKSVTENSDQKASRFDVDVKGTIERLRGINPVLDNVVKNASINQRRDMAEMMSLGAQNPSLFTEEGIARNPIISEGIRQWNEETGTDFLSVLNAFAKGERDLETRKITGSNVQAFAAENGLGREYVPALQKIAATPIEDLSQDQRSLLETLAKKDSAQKPGTYRMDLSAVAPEGKSPESIYASLVEQTDSVLKREEDRQIREEMGSTPLHAVDYSRMALPDSETETESVLDADGDQVAAYDSDGNRMDIERSNASPFNEKTIAESLADPQYSKSENTRTPITVSGEGVEEFAQSLGKKLNKDGSLTLDISPMSLVSMARQEDNRESFDEHVSEYDDSLSADENAAMRYSNLVATLADKGITFGDKQLNVQIDPKNAFAGGKVIRREKGKDPYNLKKFEEKKTWTPPTSEKLSAEHEALTRFDTASSLEDGIKAQGTKAEKQPLIALKKEVDTLAKKEGISPDQALTKIHAARSETIKKTQVNEEKSALQEALRNGDITQDHVEALADAYDSNALAEAEIDRINEGKFTPEETLKLRKSGKNVDPFGADLIKEINKNREVTIGDGMRVLEGLNRPMLKLSDGSHLRSFIEEGLPTEVAIGSGSDSVDRAAGSEPTQDEKIDSEFEASLGTPMNKEMAVRARSTPSVDPMNVNQVLDFSNRGMHQEALDSAKAVLNNRNTSEEDSIAIREMLPTLEENVQSLPKAPIQEPIQEPIQDPIVQAREAEAQRRFTEEGEYGEKKLSDEQLNTRIAELKTAYKEVRDRYTNEGAGLNPESEWFGDTIGPEAPAELQALLDEQNRRTQETPPSGGEPTDLFGSTPTESKFDSLTKAFNEAKDPRDLLGIGMEVEKAKGELTEEQVGNLRKQFKAARDRLSKSETKVQTTDGTKALSFTTIKSAITQKLLTEAQAQEYVDLYDGKASPNKEEETQTPPGGGEPVDLFGGTQNSGQNTQKPSNRKTPPPPTPPSGASSPAPKKPRKTPAQKAFVNRVEKLLGKRVAVLFDEALENNAQGSYEDIKKALKDIRDDRRDLLNDKKIDEVADRKTGLTDEEIDAEIEKILAKEQDLIKDKALLGVIKLATGAENNIAHADHESLHAAFEFFFSKEERRILATAFTQGPVAKKLKEYFKNDPGVLAALENGEEAAAYGFQLWVADPSILKVGPKTESLFQKLKDWIYKVLSIMDNNMKAEMIFKDFASGERAKRGATPVQRVLDRNMTTGDKALKLGKDAWAAIEKLYDVIFTASYSRLHNSNIPPLAKIAELGYQAQGVEGNTGGLIQRMRNESQAFQNKVNKILGDLTEEQQLAVHDALIFNRIPTRDPLVKKRAEALRAFYGQMLQYQRNAKVDIGEKKNYYPLAFDPEKVAENKEEFLKMLRQPKYADKMATLMKTPDEIYDSITSYLDRGEDLVDVMGAEKEPVAGHARERTLDFIDVKDRRQFMEDDPVHTAVRYIKQATRQAEFVRAYGVNGAKLEKLIAEAKTRYGATADDEALARDYINGLMGNKEVGMSRELKDLFGALLTYQNLRLLPLAIFSSLVDPLGVAIRTNSVKAGWETFTYSMKNMFKEWKENYTRDQWEQISQDWGIIADSGTVINAYNRYDGMTISGRSKDINDKLFKYNLLSGWIRNNTIMAVKAAQLFMQRSAEDFFGAEQSARYLEELGLTKADIIFSPSLGRIALRADEIKAANPKMTKKAAQALEEKLRNATEKVVRQSLLNPSSAETPTWVSNPYLAPIAHLKQFVWSFNMTITQRISHEMSHGNFKPALIASLYVPGMIAADFMKDMIVNAGEEPPYKKDWGAVDYLKRGVERSGLTGTGQFFIDSQQDLDWGGGGYESFAGATLQQARKGLKAVGSDNPEAMHKWIVEALPAYKLYDEALL